MAFNPCGYDGGDPGIITAMAEAIVSGGTAMSVSGATNLVNISGISSFDPEDDMMAIAAGSENFIGFSTQTTASGNPVPIATRGAFFVLADGGVTVGQPVKHNGDSKFEGAVTAGQVVGKALTGAGSEGYFVLLLK